MPLADLPARYSPKEIEGKWYAAWEKYGCFTPKIDLPRKPFTIAIPPPNVTGILHMGHALNNTIQDILIRWQRMKQVPALWVPGVDHAGIATQNVVEKKLAKEGKTRHELGREKFVEAVWKWKEEYGSTIVQQLRRLGASCDWTRERFTMDETLSRAVREAFVTLYERGLIYRGDYIINWCPRCQTALSDEEAVHKEIEGSLYYIKYPIEAANDFVTVATTRPETMLGDTAVAIHPKDERFLKLKSKKVILPLLNRPIAVIEDEFVDPEFGTGIVKVTPAHDPNDFAMGTRHQLPFVNVLNPDGTINENGGPYKGLDRFDARKKIVSDLETQGLFVKREPHRHAVGHCYRCHTVVEPYLSKQWFVKMKPLAEKALKAHAEGKVKFFPDRWNKVYVSWLENIRGWCISRQIWWGHRIPVWYCEGDDKCFPDCKKPIVAREDPTQCPACGSKNLRRDPDVLDTWFSSWLWPFSTLGWPEKTKDLAYFYPTSVLVTAQEIIFFWVARMIMAGVEFMGEVPFHSVFIHGTVRVEGGQKMSKSLGNIIDPIEIIDEMGADALRFSLMMLAATDVYLTRQKFEMGRNFTNKIWNAARFVMASLPRSSDIAKRSVEQFPTRHCEPPQGAKQSQDSEIASASFGTPPRNDASYCMERFSLSPFDKWILTELDRTIVEVDQCLKSFRFYDAANTVYHFFWHSFCDWYLELAKPALLGKDEVRKRTTGWALVRVLETSLRLMHPFLPFLTEEIWNSLKVKVRSNSFSGEFIAAARWPEPSFGVRFESEANSVRLFQDAVAGIRDLRSALELKPAELLKEVFLVPKSREAGDSLARFVPQIQYLARAANVHLSNGEVKQPGMVSKVFPGMEILVSGISPENIKEIRERTLKQIAELEGLIRSIDSRLSDEKFISKAPEEVVEKERERKSDFEKQIAAYRENLALFQ